MAQVSPTQPARSRPQQTYSVWAWPIFSFMLFAAAAGGVYFVTLPTSTLADFTGKVLRKLEQETGTLPNELSEAQRLAKELEPYVLPDSPKGKWRTQRVLGRPHSPEEFRKSFTLELLASEREDDRKLAKRLEEARADVLKVVDMELKLALERPKGSHAGGAPKQLSEAQAFLRDLEPYMKEWPHFNNFILNPHSIKDLRDFLEKELRGAAQKSSVPTNLSDRVGQLGDGTLREIDMELEKQRVRELANLLQPSALLAWRYFRTTPEYEVPLADIPGMADQMRHALMSHIRDSKIPTKEQAEGIVNKFQDYAWHVQLAVIEELERLAPPGLKSDLKY